MGWNSPQNFMVTQLATSTHFLFAFTKLSISFTYQSTASPSSFLHDIFAASRTPKRPRKSKATVVLRSLAVIFCHFYSMAQQETFPWIVESEFQISLRPCWFWRLIPFASAVHCSGIFRMGWIPCNCVILSQQASVTLNAFVPNCWLACKIMKKFWKEKRGI